MTNAPARLRELAERLLRASDAAEIEAIRVALIAEARDDDSAGLADRLRANGYTVSAQGRVPVDGAAFVTGLAPKTLSNLRHTGGGPDFVMLRRRAWYDLQALQFWLDGRTSVPEPARTCPNRPRRSGLPSR